MPPLEPLCPERVAQLPSDWPRRDPRRSVGRPDPVRRRRLRRRRRRQPSHPPSRLPSRWIRSWTRSCRPPAARVTLEPAQWHRVPEVFDHLNGIGFLEIGIAPASPADARLLPSSVRNTPSKLAYARIEQTPLEFVIPRPHSCRVSVCTQSYYSSAPPPRRADPGSAAEGLGQAAPLRRCAARSAARLLDLARREHRAGRVALFEPVPAW